MARKLTEAQKLIRLLQTQYTNSSLSSLLGYKGTSQVRKISSGTSNPSRRVLSRLQEIAASLDITTERRIPRPSDVKRKQGILRKSTWQKSSLPSFLSFAQPMDEQSILTKLQYRFLDHYLFNESYDAFLLSNVPLTNPVPNQVTGFMFEVSYTKNAGTDNETNIIQYPIYPIITILSELPADFNGLYFEVLKYLDEVRKAHEDSDFDNQLYYEYVTQTEEIRFLAFTSNL